MRYERENIQQMTAYTPGEQPQGGERVIKLNTNENPYPPIEPVMEAIRSLPGELLRKYPSPAAMGFRKAAAKAHGVTPEQIIATNGGDELLRLAISVYCAPNSPPFQGGVGGGSQRSNPPQGHSPSVASSADTIAASASQITLDPTLPQPLPRREGSLARRGIGICEPSYSLYPVLARAHDTPVTAVPLSADFGIAGDFEDRVIAASVGLVLIVNPHAPSGRLYEVTRLHQMASRLRGHAVLLIDEAYVDFAERDCVSLVKDSDLDNVLLLRTMSKGYSLAGLRFGYGIGHAGLIAAMDKVRDSYNTDALAQAAATAAISNRNLAATSWKKVIAERERMTDALKTRGWQVFPSQSNFLLAVPGLNSPPSQGGAGGGSAVQTPAAPAAPVARQIYESLKAGHILVRYFDLEGLRDKLRITIGTPQQNDAVLTALHQMMT
ncbi:MAG: aminotransferase class I/II-fold pyridoxal phosphate-dependent enzyme [Phycisphaeraceae bacterium]